MRQETTHRNTATLLDLERHDRFGLDGRFATLEELVLWKLTSRQFGWSPDDRERAVETIHTYLLDDAADYPSMFRNAFRIELTADDASGAIDAVVRALVAYLEEIHSQQTSTWDAFADINRIPPGPSRDELPQHYAGRIHGRIANQEGRVLIKRPLGFSPEAYLGFKTFFRVDGESSVGNCVACHVPPDFTDGRFHNTGISALDYESRHGEGAWTRLEIPGPEAERPVERLLIPPVAGDPSRADLGLVELDRRHAAPRGSSRRCSRGRRRSLSHPDPAQPDAHRALHAQRRLRHDRRRRRRDRPHQPGGPRRRAPRDRPRVPRDAPLGNRHPPPRRLPRVHGRSRPRPTSASSSSPSKTPPLASRKVPDTHFVPWWYGTKTALSVVWTSGGGDPSHGSGSVSSATVLGSERFDRRDPRSSAAPKPGSGSSW